MYEILANISDYDGAAAISSSVSAAFSGSGTMMKTLGGGLFAAVVVWFLVQGWAGLWNTTWVKAIESRNIARAFQFAGAVVAAVGVFLFLASHQGEDYLDGLEEQVEVALEGEAEWKQEAFKRTRAGLSVPADGGAAGSGTDGLVLNNRSDVELLAKETWDAAIDAVNEVRDLPFSLDSRLSPGPNPDAAPVVFPAEVSSENEWVDDARRSVVKYWRNQADEWVGLQFKGLRMPVSLIFGAFLGMILAIVAILAWRDIKA